MLAVQPPEEQNSTAPAGEEASPLEEAAVIIFSPPEYNYFELGPWEDVAGCWNSWPNATWSCPDPFSSGADIYYSERTHEYFDSRWQPLHFAGTKVGERGAPPPEEEYVFGTPRDQWERSVVGWHDYINKRRVG